MLGTRTQRYAVVALSLLAAVIHFIVMPDHFEEWWGYGWFMLVAAVAQTLFIPALLLARTEAKYRAVAIAGVLGNAALVAMYVYTRTAGVPVGPSAGEIEAFGEMGGIDIVSMLAEVGIVVLLVASLLELPARSSRMSPAVRGADSDTRRRHD